MGERWIGGKRSSEEAIWPLVQAHLSMATRLAMQFRGFRLPQDDLRAEAVLGLAEAALRYDPSLGVQFPTYATYWVRKRIREAVVRDRALVRVSKYRRDRWARVRAVRKDLAAELARRPTVTEISHRSGLDPLAVEDVLHGLPRCTSLDEPLGADTDLRLLETIPQWQEPDPLESLEKESALRFLRTHLERLPSRERAVLRMHFGLDGREPRPLASIATRFGLSRERIHQIEKAALKRLRSYLDETPRRAAL